MHGESLPHEGAWVEMGVALRKRFTANARISVQPAQGLKRDLVLVGHGLADLASPPVVLD